MWTVTQLNMPSLLFLPHLGLGELVILFVIVLILFGPGKLPEVARALGDGIRQFKSASRGLTGAQAGGEEEALPPQDTPATVAQNK
ncbi:MAG: twin-arginine translocase TatA/TatE family subunit [Candidatus Melainabacteria bacterium]|nr:twin-arginine translocase TatA/TatE family subunit [Candidatus Melainabacteria bacterium]